VIRAANTVFDEKKRKEVGLIDEMNSQEVLEIRGAKTK